MLLLEIVSIGIIFAGAVRWGVILLALSVLYGVYLLLTGKKKEKPETNKYIFTHNALMNGKLSDIIEHNIISGEFFVSTRIVSEQKNRREPATGNDFLFENLSSLKRRGRLMYVNSGSSISEILAYAYRNECAVVSSNEHISKKILQVFSVKVIDIGFLARRRGGDYRKGEEIKVFVESRSDEGFTGRVAGEEKVVVYDLNLAESTLIDAEVEKVLEISGEKTIYAKKKS